MLARGGDILRVLDEGGTRPPAAPGLENQESQHELNQRRGSLLGIILKPRWEG